MSVNRDIKSWIGFDLDGTLAESGPEHSQEFLKPPPWKIGKPIPAIVNLAKEYIKYGCIVKIFTGRIATLTEEDLEKEVKNIQDFTLENLGEILEVTCIKDYGLRVFYDDRARSVEKNTGRSFSFDD